MWTGHLSLAGDCRSCLVLFHHPFDYFNMSPPLPSPSACLENMANIVDGHHCSNASMCHRLYWILRGPKPFAILPGMVSIPPKSHGRAGRCEKLVWEPLLQQYICCNHPVIPWCQLRDATHPISPDRMQLGAINIPSNT